MKTNSKGSRSKARRNWIITGIIILVVAGAGFGYYWTQQQSAKSAQAASENTLQTTRARTGNITLTASGTGTLVPSQTTDLTFSSAGTVGILNVKPGDQVKSGQVLAQLSDLSSLQANVNTAKVNLLSAQQTLETFKTGAGAALGNAQLAVATDQKAVTDAQSKLITPGTQRCDQTTTDAYYQDFLAAQKNLSNLGIVSSTSPDYTNIYLPTKTKADQAWATYQTCLGFTSYEVSSSQANLAIAKANLKTAQDTLNKLTANNGIDPDQLAQDQNALDSAQMALTSAQKSLDGAALTAPFDATVVAVAGQLGSSVNSSASFITISDLAHPFIQFYIDETDLQMLRMDADVSATFDAYPGQTFTGKVVQIVPKLVTVSGYQAVQATAKIDLPATMAKTTLPQGLNASVDVVSASAKNVVLVPVQALRDLGDGSYAVFVVTNGKPVLRVVTVGLQNAADAEIKSGLKSGEVVSTGLAATTNSTN